jgi:hypothetical protein
MLAVTLDHDFWTLTVAFTALFLAISAHFRA